MKIGRSGRAWPVCGGPAQGDPGGRVVAGVFRESVKKSRWPAQFIPLPKGDMRVKHLCKGNVPPLLWFFFKTASRPRE